MTDPVSKISITTLSSSAAARRPGPGGDRARGRLERSGEPGGHVALTWGAATDNVAIAGYRISRDGTC